MIMANSTRESRQRKFIRDLFPFHGQHVAAAMAGFTPPSLDGQLSELRESVKLWQQVTASGAEDCITESSWWMAQISDPLRRASLPEMISQQGQLNAFAVGVLGQLLEKGVIKWADEDMVLPDIKIETQGFPTPEGKLSDDELIDVARLLSDLKDDDTDE